MIINCLYILVAAIFLTGYTACKMDNNKSGVFALPKASILQSLSLNSSLLHQSNDSLETNRIHTGNTSPEELLTFARTLTGVPYKYASALPDSGFDCSGFITFVFNHFNINVPRASISFTNMEKEISLTAARPGDLILFTGTDTSIHTVGHMGIIDKAEKGQLYFIHASSGKANGVTISPLDGYYKSRFVKVIRVFP